MPLVGVIDALELVGMSRAFVESYGLKTSGYAELLSLRAERPADFGVPPAWAVPPRSEGTASEADLRRAFDTLTSPLRIETVLMARGSSLTERPGRSPTLYSLFEPRDPEGGFRAFASRIREIRAADRDMGVLATVMVGGLSTFPEGSWAMGWENVSFVADTHNPIAPGEMHVAAVSGLGTRAVAEGGEAVLVTVDRATGLISGFVNKTEEAFLRPFVGSRSCLSWRDYRQKEADYFDPHRGLVRSRTLDPYFFHDLRFDADGVLRQDLPRVFCGRLVRRYGEVSLREQNEYTAKTGLPKQEIEVGANPFIGGDPMVSNLTGILRFLERRAGAVQVEGAFDSHVSTRPWLYQMIRVPEAVWEQRPLRVREAHLHTKRVIGAAEFMGPLLWTPFEQLSVLQALDRRFAGTGYILLLPSHTGEAIAATPHCRLRLSSSLLNLGSHAMTLARLKISEEPEAGYVVAMDVKIKAAGRGAIAGREADEEVSNVCIRHRAHLDSNGREMAVEIL